MERRHETVPLASRNLRGLGRAMVTAKRRGHSGTGTGPLPPSARQQGAVPAGDRAGARPGSTKGSDGPSLEIGAAKAPADQELLLLLLGVSVTCPRSERRGAGAGMCLCIPSETPAQAQNHRMVGTGRDLCGSPSPTLLPKQGHPEQAAQGLVQAGLEYLQRRRHLLPPGGTSHPPGTRGAPPGSTLPAEPPSPASRGPAAHDGPPRPSSPAAACSAPAPAAPARCFHSKLGEAGTFLGSVTRCT